MAPSQQQQQQQLQESRATTDNFSTTATTVLHHFISNTIQISGNSFQHFPKTCLKAKIQPVSVEEITGSTPLSAIRAFPSPDSTSSTVCCKFIPKEKRCLINQFFWFGFGLMFS